MKGLLPDEITIYLKRQDDGDFELHYSEWFDLDKHELTEEQWGKVIENTVTLCAIVGSLAGKKVNGPDADITVWDERHTLHFHIRKAEPEKVVSMLKEEIMGDVRYWGGRMDEVVDEWKKKHGQ
ncbi:MAG: hypothetical protein PHZ19_00325 [Candidatus Thermoplasmatota archaeon]|nr:hypothetical protein [Candidatus Thermoplasmatota archaeon]